MKRPYYVLDEVVGPVSRFCCQRHFPPTPSHCFSWPSQKWFFSPKDLLLAFAGFQRPGYSTGLLGIQIRFLIKALYLQQCRHGCSYYRIHFTVQMCSYHLCVYWTRILHIFNTVIAKFLYLPSCRKYHSFFSNITQETVLRSRAWKYRWQLSAKW